MIYPISSSLPNNLIYSIHYSYYSILISVVIENSLLLFHILIHYSYSNALPYCYFIFYSNSTISIWLLFTLRLSITIRLLDLFIESYFSSSIIEQSALIVGIKLLLLSELMLFFACFWCYINFRLIGSIISLFYFPLLSCYSFPIPFTNPLIPLFPSLSIQCSQISIKFGFLNYLIEGVGQSSSIGFYSIILQCKEFSFSYFSVTDCLIGPIYYFTTGLHGFHVLLGAFLFCLILFYIMLYWIQPFYWIR